jgi:hypothetical protein
MRKLATVMGLALLCALWMAPCAAAEGQQPERKKKGFGLGFGWIYASFDTNAKFTNKESGYSVFLDAEGTLGLPASDSVPVVYGAYRFSPKHAFGFSYFQIRREVTFFDEDFQIEDATLSGEATLRDKTRFYNVNYNYTFFEDDRSQIFGVFGIYGLDLNYTFEAVGEITIGEDTEAGEYSEEAQVLAPLPLFGVNFWFAFTPKWSVSAKFAFVAGKYQDVTAGVFSSMFNARYQFVKRMGLLVGMDYFEADVRIEDSLEKTEVSYGYTGVFIGLHVVF